MHHAMNPDRVRALETAIDEACRTVSHQTGARIVVTCAAGAQITGDWIDIAGGRYGNRLLLIYGEDQGGITTTRVEFESIAAVGTVVEADAPVDEQGRVPPSRKPMTIASVLLQAWGRVNGIPTYGDLRQALDDIDGSGSVLGGTPNTDQRELDTISDALLPQVDKVLLHIAARNSPNEIADHIQGATLATLIMDDDLRDVLMADEQIRGAIRSEMKGEVPIIAHNRDFTGTPKGQSAIREMPEEIRDRITAIVRLARARRELERAYHPFIERGRLFGIARGF